MTSHLPRYLTIRAVAESLGVSVQAVHYRIQQGQLDSVEREGRKYVLLKSLTKWKQERIKRGQALISPKSSLSPAKEA